LKAQATIERQDSSNSNNNNNDNDKTHKIVLFLFFSFLLVDVLFSYWPRRSQSCWLRALIALISSVMATSCSILSLSSSASCSTVA
jgi:hypothetical protein